MEVLKMSCFFISGCSASMFVFFGSSCSGSAGVEEGQWEACPGTHGGICWAGGTVDSGTGTTMDFCQWKFWPSLDVSAASPMLYLYISYFIQPFYCSCRFGGYDSCSFVYCFWFWGGVSVSLRTYLLPKSLVLDLIGIMSYQSLLSAALLAFQSAFQPACFSRSVHFHGTFIGIGSSVRHGVDLAFVDQIGRIQTMVCILMMEPLVTRFFESTSLNARSPVLWIGFLVLSVLAHLFFIRFLRVQSIQTLVARLKHVPWPSVLKVNLHEKSSTKLGKVFAAGLQLFGGWWRTRKPMSLAKRWERQVTTSRCHQNFLCFDSVTHISVLKTWRGCNHGTISWCWHTTLCGCWFCLSSAFCRVAANGSSINIMCSSLKRQRLKAKLTNLGIDWFWQILTDIERPEFQDNKKLSTRTALRHIPQKSSKKKQQQLCCTLWGLRRSVSKNFSS